MTRSTATSTRPGASAAESSIVAAPAEGWRSERIVSSGDAAFAGLIADIGLAQRSIELESYIVTDDPVVRRIAEALVAAVRRGVRVRLLADGIGGGRWVRCGAAALVEAGVEVRVYHPWPLLMFPSSPCGWSDLQSTFPLLFTVNRRNHRKIWVIDGRIAWIGSVNLTADHSREVNGDAAWRDTAVRVEGEAIGAIRIAMAATWAKSWRLAGSRLRWPDRPGAPADAGGHRSRWPMLSKARMPWTASLRSGRTADAPAIIRLNDRRGMRRRLIRDLLDRIAQARRRVWIANPYLVPTRRFAHALSQAIRNGADVRLLVPAVTDMPFIAWLAASSYHGFLSRGVRIFHYLPGMLHAKTVLIDGWATVGSSNLNYRSLFHDLEADAVLGHPASLAQLEADFLADLQRAEEVTIERWRARPLAVRIAGAIALRLRWWM